MFLGESMKTWKSILNTVLAAQCTIFANIPSLIASTIPQDMQQLLNNWQEVKKTESADKLVHITTGNRTLGEDLTGIDRLLAEIGRMRDEGIEKFDAVHFDLIKENVRTKLLSELFPSKETAPKFCQSLVQKPIKINEPDTLTEEEKRLLQAKADYNNCKKVFRDVVSGIVFADPQTYYLKVLNNSEPMQGEIVVWIYSVIDPNFYLRYQLSL